MLFITCDWWIYKKKDEIYLLGTPFLQWRKRRPTFYRIWKKGDVEDFSPIPYLATVLNCMLWVFYGLPLVHPHSLLVLTINGIGLVVELIYLSMYFTYSSKMQKVWSSLFLSIKSCDPSFLNAWFNPLQKYLMKVYIVWPSVLFVIRWSLHWYYWLKWYSWQLWWLSP